MAGIVVVGAGQAAAEFTSALRSGGYAGRVTIVGDEPHLPYQRPPLSKDFLAGRIGADKLLLRPEAYWREQRVELRLGASAQRIDPVARGVTLADGSVLKYDTLVLATGARARIPPLPGLDLPGVFLLRAIEDVTRLRPALRAARRVAIVGGGYIGLEVAAVARAEGRDVLVLEAEDRVMKRVTGNAVSAFYLDLHRRKGVDVRLRARLDGIEAGGDRLVLRAGLESLEADLVLVSTGARPNEELAAAAGLDCLDGIAVDEATRTSDPHIHAIGDCTRFPSGRYGRRIRLECVQNAFDQGRAASATLLGKEAPYDPVPWFWSDQYDIKFQSAGLSEGHDDAKVVGDPASGRFSVEYRRSGRLIAVDAVNDARAYMAGRKRIAQETAA